LQMMSLRLTARHQDWIEAVAAASNSQGISINEPEELQPLTSQPDRDQPTMEEAGWLVDSS
jgi:hypothetical protein